MTHAAAAWLRDQLSQRGSPLPQNMCMKGVSTNILFAEFLDATDRDTAVALIRGTRLQHNGKDIWASPDRPQLERAARNYCFGLKYLLKDTKITDSSPHEVSAGGEPALAATVAGNAAKKERADTWA
eukprot:1756504-Pyramimonas_sp.AAC.1